MDRIKILDAFRGIAALMVVAYHYTTRYNQIFSVESFFSMSFGWLGVPLFFMLSGFVITLTLNNSVSISDFFLKRFIRLYPTYWICLVISIIFIYSNSILQDSKISSFEIVANFSMFQEFFDLRHVDGSYWSLLPELKFYAMMGLLFFFKLNKNIFVVNSVILGYCLLHYFFPIPFIWRVLNVHYVLLFIIGIHLYTIYKKQHTIHNHLFVLLNLILSLFLYQLAQPSQNIFFLGITFGFIVFVFYLFAYNKLEFLSKSKILLFFGMISYPFYLLHQNIGYIIINYFETNFNLRLLGTIIAFFLTIGLASIIVFRFEKTQLPKIRKKILK